MKLAKKAQYALLLVLYLARTGRARTVDAAQALGLSTHFLEQVARKLRQAGVICSVRGPGGGYELDAVPTIGAVLDAVQVLPVLTKDEMRQYAESSLPEGRILGEIAAAISASIGVHLASDVLAATPEGAAQ